MIFFKVRVIFKSKTQQNLHEMKLSITVKSQILNYFTFGGKKPPTNTTILSVLFEILHAISSWLHPGILSVLGMETNPVQFQSSAFMTCEVQCKNTQAVSKEIIAQSWTYTGGSGTVPHKKKQNTFQSQPGYIYAALTRTFAPPGLPA